MYEMVSEYKKVNIHSIEGIKWGKNPKFGENGKIANFKKIKKSKKSKKIEKKKLKKFPKFSKNWIKSSFEE